MVSIDSLNDSRLIMMFTMKKVVVLLSSYNGEKYIKEQIDSILVQEKCSVQLLVRDDGSTDNTRNILEDYQKKGLLQWYAGINLGPAKSFMDLIRKAPDADFYALCDQDDYWFRDKLITATNMIGNSADPVLYFSQTQLADPELHPIKTPKLMPRCTMGEALIAFYATGCTFVFNKKLRGEVLNYVPQYISMHDNWIYRVCLAVGGTIIFDPVAHILYRQHTTNVIGLKHTFWQNWQRRISGFTEGRHERSRTAMELLSGYEEKMSNKDRNLVSLAASTKKSFKARIKLILQKDLKCQSRQCNLTARLAILLGIY